MRTISDQCQLTSPNHHTDISIDAISSQPPTSPSRSYLTIKGHRLETPIEGALMESVFQVGNRYLVFLTEGVLHEDTLWVHLIDENHQVIDKLWFFGMYSTGVLSNIRIESENIMTFSFFDGDRWKLTVHQEKKRQIPWIIKKYCVHRDFSFSCYMTLKRVPS